MPDERSGLIAVAFVISKRLDQIFVPLLSIIEDPEARRDLQELAKRDNREMIADRGMDMEAQILEIIQEILFSPCDAAQLPLKTSQRCLSSATAWITSGRSQANGSARSFGTARAKAAEEPTGWARILYHYRSG